MRTRYTAFRCPEDLLEKAKAKAGRDRRTLSNYLVTLIEKDVCGDEAAVRPPRRERAESGSVGLKANKP
jgi:hypothetical protein